MKLVEYVVEIFEESLRIIFYPKLHWLRVKAERDVISGGFRKFFVPGILFVFIAVFIGDLIFESEYGFLFWDTLIKATRKIILLLLTLIASNMLLYEISRGFKIPIAFEESRKITIYSMLPLVLLAIVTGFFPFFDVVGIFAFYCFYLAYSGLNVLFGVQLQRNYSFLIILAGFVFFTYFFLAFLLTKLTALIIY
ncbi:MAG: YIP1 family protein [Prolixibacteraceae bacterium]|jgi:hypothetical protein|nr:YIP1 family protein [Prolixibacteraceae bacterium]